MKSMIPPPEQLFEDLLDELEALDKDVESNEDFERLFSQVTAELTEAQLATVAEDHQRMAQDRETGEKSVISHVTRAVLTMIQRALIKNDGADIPAIPQTVVKALQRMDEAPPLASASPFHCRNCGVIFEFCILRSDVDRFLQSCPFCGEDPRPDLAGLDTTEPINDIDTDVDPAEPFDEGPCEIAPETHKPKNDILWV